MNEDPRIKLAHAMLSVAESVLPLHEKAWPDGPDLLGGARQMREIVTSDNFNGHDLWAICVRIGEGAEGLKTEPTWRDLANASGKAAFLSLLTVAGIATGDPTARETARDAVEAAFDAIAMHRMAVDPETRDVKGMPEDEPSKGLGHYL